MSFDYALQSYIPIDLNEMRPKDFFKQYSSTILHKYKTIESKSGWKEVTNCPLCNSTDSKLEFVKYDKIEIRGCKECGLRFNNFIPKNTNDLYSDESYLGIAKSSYDANRDYRKMRFGKERIEILNTFLKKKKDPKLLDLGCGTGWFLELAREEGFSIYGQELGMALSQYASEVLNIKIYRDLNEIEEKNYFDVITMFDLIEHVPDPLEMINKAIQLIKKGGLILIFTPNFDSYAVSKMKEDSNMVTPADHLMYFNRSSIEYLAEKLDVELLFFQTKGIDMGDLKSYYEAKGDMNISNFYNSFADEMQPMIDSSASGNHIRFILSKNV